MASIPQIVIVEPAIPQNTGNIARLTAANRTSLHLIEPLGFRITDATVKRAGLDYWPETDVHTYESWEKFLSVTAAKESQLWFFSTKGTLDYYDAKFSADDFLVFGSETKGLSNFFHESYPERRLRIPMENPNVRSLNLASSAAIVLYEAKRQLRR